MGTIVNGVKFWALAAVVAASGATFSGANADGHGDDTLATVQQRGELICGVDGSLPGFSSSDDAGIMRGVDADVCYAIAAAALGDAAKVQFLTVTPKERFTALASGVIDVLSNATTHTASRDASLGLNFTYYNFISGAGFMVKKSLGVKSAKELGGARLCVTAGTTTEQAVGDYFRDNNLAPFTPKPFDTPAQTREGYERDACDVMSSDKALLALTRGELADPAGSIILPETISKEPLGPVVRQGDDGWFNLVKWVLYAMINAEEMGAHSANIDAMRDSSNPGIRRLVGAEGGLCRLIDARLNDDCFYQVIKQVGNIGESYEANVGENTVLGLARAGSVNDLWTRGGLMYAPPLR